MESNSTSNHFNQRLNQSESNLLSPKFHKSCKSAESPYFDVGRFVPKGIKARFTEKGGSLFIAHSINEFAIKVLKRKVDLIIFQCVLRFSLGFRRPVCKLSYTFIANWTGLQIPNVRRGISNLIEMELIIVAIPHSSKELKATIYEVPIVREYLEWSRGKEEKSNLYSNDLPIHNQTDYDPMSDLITKKEKEKEKLKTTLSNKPNLHAELKSYLIALRPHQKRVDEEHFLNQLLLDYKSEEILKALYHVQSKGTVDTREPVHSPMKYLSYTIESVLISIKEQDQKLQKIESLRRETEEKILKEEREREEEAELYRRAISKFESKLTEDEQNQYLNSYYQENYGGTGGIVPRSIIKRVAVSDWYRENV